MSTLSGSQAWSGGSLTVSLTFQALHISVTEVSPAVNIVYDAAVGTDRYTDAGVTKYFGSEGGYVNSTGFKFWKSSTSGPANWTADDSGTTYTIHAINTYIYNIALERGPHTIYGQVTDSVGTVTTAPIVYVMAYELTEYGIDVYSGDALLDVIEPVLHDELLPALPTLNFSCATLLTGTIQAVIRERGLRQYQFTIATVGASNGLYQYTCKAAESYALTSAIMVLQTAYGATLDAIRRLVPSLNIMGADLLAQTTYPQLFANITPTEVIKQLLIQALAQASVRNGNLYVFPLDISAQIPDYHMQRLDPLTGWQKDADTFDAVTAHYIVKQYPTPDTALTLHDAANWTGTVTDVTQVDATLLPVPSGALGMLHANGNASRAGLSTLFKNFDRLQFNWNPPDLGSTVLVSLQQNASNKLELTHTFAGQTGAGFILTGSPGVPTDILTKNITLSPVQYVTTVEGTTTGSCSYRVTLLNAAGATIWQDAWAPAFGNTFRADVPTSISQSLQAATVRIEFTDLYLIVANYGVQCVQCDITVQTYNNVGSHERIVSAITYTVAMNFNGSPVSYNRYGGQIPLMGATSGQWYRISDYPSFLAIYSSQGWLDDVNYVLGHTDYGAQNYSATATILETVQDYAWISAPFVWSPAFNLFESVTLALADFTRTGNPTNLATIALTFTGDNYIDTLVMVADNPLPVTVRAGTGSRAYPVTDDFGSEAGAQAYADGLLPVVSVAREQYTRDVPLETDLSVGDTISGDGTPMTVYAVDYRQSGKTLAAGRSMDTLMSRLSEQSRRLGTLERKV